MMPVDAGCGAWRVEIQAESETQENENLPLSVEAKLVLPYHVVNRPKVNVVGKPA